MIALLDRYFALALVVSLVIPLWLRAFSISDLPGPDALRDALMWTILLFAGLLLIKVRRYQVRGSWRSPTRAEWTLYSRLLLAVLLIDYGSKLAFFRTDQPHPVELVRNFGLHSVFHEAAFEPFHFYIFLYFLFLFCLGALFFRFSAKLLDRIWLASAAFALGGVVALFAERLVFGGVHNSFYFSGPLMWLCPPCASLSIHSYAWTPADFFVHAAVAPLFILIASYFWPVDEP